MKVSMPFSMAIMILLMTATLLVSSSKATKLLFSKEDGSFPTEIFNIPGKSYDLEEGVQLPNSYGDNVVAEVQSGFVYGSEGGFTPHITTSYGTGQSIIRTWPGGSRYGDYGNLTNVVYAGLVSYGATNPAVLGEIGLQAENGYLVRLSGFAMAGFIGGGAVSKTINYVKVLDGQGNTLFSQQNVLLPCDSNTTFDFAISPMQSRTIRIQWDATNLNSWIDPSLGVGYEDVGMDNIVFSEVAVPEPCTLLLIGLGGLTVLRKRRA